ncbi:hypothetical protein AMEX_G25189 [Astyanax mexicanus]|uniref:Uncharacterized protein n=1 Tax=Astyanax mexicanus TaxID=7994 RepID=A0A8T2KPN4_ASTMX|nr:hypothetical protein AMEX_G25189 [Astyanax mexicanus]
MSTGNRSQGSYLKVYFGTLSVEKRTLLEKSLEAECRSAAAGGKEDVRSEGQQGVQKDKFSNDEEGVNDRQLEHPPSKKSSTCTVL